MPHNLARRVLADVPDGQEFVLASGERIKNLKELRDSLKTMYSGTFAHHVNDERNDFVSWIRFVIRDDELADDLLELDSKEDTYEAVVHRVAELKKHLEKHYHEEMKKLHETRKRESQIEKKIKLGEHAHAHSHIQQKPPHPHELHFTEQELIEREKGMIVKEFFYGMATGVILCIILFRMIQFFK